MTPAAPAAAGAVWPRMLTLRRDHHEVVLGPEIGGSIAGFRPENGDIAEVVTARLEGRDPGAGGFPSVEDDVRGVKFIEVAVGSSARGAVWVDARISI